MQSYFMLSMLLYYFIFKNMKWKLSFTSLNDLQPTLYFSPSKSSMRRQVVEAVHGISTQLGLQLHEVLSSSKGLCRSDFGAVRINVSFCMLLILFHNGFHPRAILVRLHPKAILGSELGEGGACALPSHCQRLVSMLRDIFLSHFRLIVLHLRWCSAKKKLRKCLKDSTLLLKFLIPGVEVQCLLRISLRLNIASAWFALLI